MALIVFIVVLIAVNFICIALLSSLKKVNEQKKKVADVITQLEAIRKGINRQLEGETKYIQLGESQKAMTITEPLSQRDFTSNDNKVWAFLLNNALTLQEQLLLVGASTDKEARFKMAKALTANGFNPNDWLIRLTHHIDIQKQLTKEQEKEKTLDEFINTLKYISDKFAPTLAQKKVLSTVISNVKSHYVGNTAK